MSTPMFRGALALAAFLGLLHLLVDTASLKVLYDEAARDRQTDEGLRWWTELYNVLAFGLQLPLGILADRQREYRVAALIGFGLLIVALLVGTDFASGATILAGLGNALFHLGSAGLLLNRCRGRATEAGIFVAPGALGVALGIHLGGGMGLAHALLILALLAAGMVLALDRIPILGRMFSRAGPCAGRESGQAEVWNARPILPIPGLVLAGAAFLFLSIMGRSLAAGAFSTPIPGQAAAALLLLAPAAFLGKSLGGFLADRLGWRLTAVAALLCLAGLASKVLAFPDLRPLGMFLAQVPMAVTLAGLALALPGRPATAFGTASLALLLGSYLGDPGRGLFQPASHLAPLVLLSVITVFLGLTLACPRTGPEWARTSEPKKPLP